MMIIERQSFQASSVRSVCCKNDLYTRGTNEEYDAMFNMVYALYPKSIITAEDLYPIAADILAHSDTEMCLCDILDALGAKITRSYEVID